MKRYPSYLLFSMALALVLIMGAGCGSEDNSNSTNPPADSLTADPIPENELGFRYSWKLDAGTSWRMKTLETTTMVFNPGTDQETRQQTVTTINRKANLKEIDKELALNIAITYVDIVQGSGKDGKKGESDPNDPRLGKSLNVRMEPNTGQVLTVRGADVIFKAGGMEISEGTADDLMRESINNEFYIYADGPVEIGKTWQRSGKLRSPFGLNYAHIYTLDKQMNGQGFIKRSTTFTAGEVVPELNASGSIFNLTGTATADFNVDDATGMIFSKVENTVLEGTVEDAQNPGKVSLRIEISSISEMTIQ
jgi:hypothetical protein